jgi:peroxiredoxin
MRHRAITLGCLIIGTVLPSHSIGAETLPPTSSLGRAVSRIPLKDTKGQPFSLADLKAKKAVVVIFIGTQCPINNAYMPRLVELHESYAGKGVQLVAIDANIQDSAEEVAEHAAKHKLPFPVLRDSTGDVARQFGARRTPEAFVLDADRKIRYQGRIDDQFGVSISRPRPTQRDLALAIDEVLAGKKVTQPTTPVAGCLIGRAAGAKKEGAITYAKQISRILQKNCQECHRPGQIGPMSLLTYRDAAAWSDTIREVIEEKRMPPWHADPRHGKFQNDRSLPRAERDALLAWIDAGCPKGDDKDLPAPIKHADGWRIGKPDKVFTMNTAFKVPAQAAKGVKYKHFLVSTTFEDDVWVQAAEARPGNRAVVHHIIVYVVDVKKARPRSPDGIGNGFLVAHAPGDLPSVFPAGYAKKIPKGSSLVFQMHYTPNGVEQTDQSSVGLIFAKKPPEYEVRTRSIARRALEIPAGEPNFKAEASSTFQENTLLVSLFPHMHLRGKDFLYRVIFPDGKSETLLSVPRYDFNWQNNYRLEKARALPAGTRIECTAHYDNSANNPNNPDPTKVVRWGDQTWDEMMIGFVDYALPVAPSAKKS